MSTTAGQRTAEATALERDRYEATNRWFWISSTVGAAILAALLAAAIPTYGWLPFLLLGVPALAGSIGHNWGPGLREHWYGVSQLAWLIAVGFSAAVTEGADSFLVPLLCVYALPFFSRLPPQLAATYSCVSFVLACAPILVLDWDGFVDAPWLVGSTAVGLVTLTIFASHMAAGELHHRGEATIDQLTGLLNRRGLEERLAELRQQALVISHDTPLALIASDLDHFKTVNDTYGHPGGDQVLRDVAYLMRKELRRFELAYRMGGEEFLIVLPGHDAAAALTVAESIRTAIEQGRPGGVDVTISMGVAVSRAADIDVERLLQAADAAVYAAKRGGRNRVVLAAPTDSAPRTGLAPTESYSI